MRRRTLLFGAGMGARVFMKNTAHERIFIGLLDNDERKYDVLFEGLPVYHPSQWVELEFDEIVITTQWALDVQSQLVNELKVPSDKVCLPHKSKLKNPEPFADPATLQLARTIILKLNELAIEHGIALVIDFGTLLGISRDGDLIPWDDDVDFSAPVEQVDAVKDLLQVFVQNNQRSDLIWEPTTIQDRYGKTSCFLLRFKPVADSSLQPFSTSLCFRQFKNGQAVHIPSLGMWYAPEKHFRGHHTLAWQEQSVQVPVDYLDYLAFVYGEDWATPKKNIQLSDYAHLNETDFAAIQDAGFVTSEMYVQE